MVILDTVATSASDGTTRLRLAFPFKTFGRDYPPTISGQRPDRHAATLIAVDIFNENILRRSLDADALVTIRDLNVMEIAVIGTYEINPIRSSLVGTSDGDLVCLQV
jgi:hypothetical protein